MFTIDVGLLQSAGIAFVSIAGTFFALRKRYSNDTASIAADKTQTSLMATLLAERDSAMNSAREAWSQRVHDATEIGKQQGLLMAQEREMSRLRDEIFSLRLHIRKMASLIVKLDPAAAQQMGITSDSDGIPQNMRNESDIIRSNIT